jgi:hypothetical protein
MRDPRRHYISAFYEVEVNDISTLNAGDDASDATFENIEELLKDENLFAINDHYTTLKSLI